MMYQADDRDDAAGAESVETMIDPVPCLFAECFHSFPQNREAHRAHAERGETLDVIRTDIRAAAMQLIDVLVAYTIQRTLDSGPYL